MFFSNNILSFQENIDQTYSFLDNYLTTLAKNVNIIVKKASTDAIAGGIVNKILTGIIT